LHDKNNNEIESIRAKNLKKMHQFKELLIWQKSRSFCSEIYTITSTFPNDEKFGLTNQLRRASVSIPSNIAEGSSRNSNKDFSRFLEIAIGSAYEIETQLLIASDLGFIKIEQLELIINQLDEIIKMISKLKSTLKM
jgi:four helix bundle protein